MNALESIFSWVLTTTWQASVLAVLVLIAQWTLGSRLNPRWRHALWLLVILRLVLPDVPESALSLFRYAPAAPLNLPATYLAPSTVTVVHILPYSAHQETAITPHENHLLPILAIIWLGGALGLLLLTWLVNHRFARHVANAPQITDASLRKIFADAKAELNIRRHIRLVESTQVTSPAIMGLFSPTLLLPTNAQEKFTPRELRFIFLHELAHLKRGDVFVQALIALLQILHWFNPVLWYAFHRLRADREPATDALVLSRTGEADKEPYGLMLLKLLEHFNQRHALPTLVGILEDKDQFKRRFGLIAKFTRGAYAWSLLGVALLVLLAAVCLTKAKAQNTPITAEKYLELVFVEEPGAINSRGSGPRSAADMAKLQNNPKNKVTVMADLPLKTGPISLKGQTPAGFSVTVTGDWNAALKTPQKIGYRVDEAPALTSIGTTYAYSWETKDLLSQDSPLIIFQSWKSDAHANVIIQIVDHPTPKTDPPAPPQSQTQKSSDAAPHELARPFSNSSQIAAGQKPLLNLGITLVEVSEKAYEAEKTAMDQAIADGNLGYFAARKDAFVSREKPNPFPRGKGWYSQGVVLSYVQTAAYDKDKASGKVMTTLNANAVFLGINGDFKFNVEPTGIISADSAWQVTEPETNPSAVPPADATPAQAPSKLDLSPKFKVTTASDKDWRIVPGRVHAQWIGPTLGQVTRTSGFHDAALMSIDGMAKNKVPSRLAVFLTADLATAATIPQSASTADLLTTKLVSAAGTGDLKWLRNLIEQGADPNGRRKFNPNGTTDSALDRAVTRYHYDVVAYLLEHGAKVQPSSYIDASGHEQPGKVDEMIEAEELDEHGDAKMVKLFWDHGVRSISELSYAITQGASSDDVTKMLAAGSPVDPPQDTCAKPLAVAACYGRLDLVTLLVQRDAKVDPGNDSADALYFAAFNGRDDIASFLLQHGAHPRYGDFSGATSAFNSWYNSGQNLDLSHYEHLLRAMLDTGALHDLTDKDKGRILSESVGHPSLLKMLLDAGLSPELPLIDLSNKSHGTVISHVRESAAQSPPDANLKASLALLNAADKTTSAPGPDPDAELITAVKKNDDATVQKLIDQGVDPARVQDQGQPLIFAAESPDVAEILLQHGANANARDQQDDAVINYICRNGGKQAAAIVGVLLAHGADPNTHTGGGGETPLMDARDTATVDVLIAHGADVNARMNDGSSLLAVAHFQPPEYLADLLRHGVRFDPKKEGPMLLLHAAWVGNLPLMTDLLNRGVDPNLPALLGMDKSKPNLMTPLSAAVVDGGAEAAKLLLKHGARVEQKDAQEALVNRRMDVLRLFWEQGARPISELTYAISQDAPAADIQKLLDAGAPVDPPQDKPFTPLVLAAELGRLDLVTLLVQRGAQVSFAPEAQSHMYNPLNQAAWEGQDEVVAYLLQRGAKPGYQTIWNAAWNVNPLDAQRRPHFEKTLQTLVDSGVLNGLTPEEKGRLLDAVIETRSPGINANALKILLHAGLSPDLPMTDETGKNYGTVLSTYRDYRTHNPTDPRGIFPLVDLLEAAAKTTSLPSPDPVPAVTSAAYTPAEANAGAAGDASPRGFARVEVKIVHLGEEDYQSHRAQIDAAVQRGDIGALLPLPSCNVNSLPAVVMKSGEQGVVEAVRVLPYAIDGHKGPDGAFVATDYKRVNLGVRVVLHPEVRDGKILLRADPFVRSLDGWTGLDTNLPSPQIHERHDDLNDVFADGETKGFPFPGGAEMDPVDPSYCWRATDKPDPAKSRKINGRVFYFITARVAGELTAAPLVTPPSPATYGATVLTAPGADKGSIALDYGALAIEDSVYAANRGAVDHALNHGKQGGVEHLIASLPVQVLVRGKIHTSPGNPVVLAFPDSDVASADHDPMSQLAGVIQAGGDALTFTGTLTANRIRPPSAKELAELQANGAARPTIDTAQTPFSQKMTLDRDDVVLLATTPEPGDKEQNKPARHLFFFASAASTPGSVAGDPAPAERSPEVTISGRLRLVHPEQIMKSTGYLTSVDGGAPIEFGFQPDGSFSIPHVKPGVYNRRIRFVGASGAAAETNLEPVTVGAASATMTMNIGMDVRISAPAKGEIQIALKLIEIDDGYYRTHKEKVDAAIEKADLAYFVNLQGVSMLSCPSVSTMPDLKADIDIVREFPYPTQFEPSKVVPNQKVTGAGGTQTVTLMVPPTPREFVTRDVGVSAEITPTINGPTTTAPGKIVLLGRVTVTDFEGFVKSNVDGVSNMPCFNTSESNFLEQVGDRELKGVWIPGLHAEEPPAADKDAPPYASAKPGASVKRMLLFVSAERVP